MKGGQALSLCTDVERSNGVSQSPKSFPFAEIVIARRHLRFRDRSELTWNRLRLLLNLKHVGSARDIRFEVSAALASVLLLLMCPNCMHRANGLA